MSTFLADSLRDIRRLCDQARVSLDQSSSVNISGNLCKIPVDLYSPVRILETSAFFSTFSMFMLG